MIPQIQNKIQIILMRQNNKISKSSIILNIKEKITKKHNKKILKRVARFLNVHFLFLIVWEEKSLNFTQNSKIGGVKTAPKASFINSIKCVLILSAQGLQNFSNQLKFQINKHFQIFKQTHLY